MRWGDAKSDGATEATPATPTSPSPATSPAGSPRNRRASAPINDSPTSMPPPNRVRRPSHDVSASGGLDDQLRHMYQPQAGAATPRQGSSKVRRLSRDVNSDASMFAVIGGGGSADGGDGGGGGGGGSGRRSINLSALDNSASIRRKSTMAAPGAADTLLDHVHDKASGGASWEEQATHACHECA